MKNKKNKKNFILGTTSIGERGQIVIPAKIRETLGLKKGDKILLFSRSKVLHLVKAESVLDKLKKIIAELQK